MHRHAAAFLVLSIIIVSGCLSGQTIKRQSAEPADNLSLQANVDYGEDTPEEQPCTCPDSIRTCQDGFNDTCENECDDNGSCGRCMPGCAGHGRCNETWFCGEWTACSGGMQLRRCIDSSFCNRTGMVEKRVCETDACTSDSDCPAQAGCTVYFCEGSPKECKPYVRIPCCGDGKCDGDGDCLSDCPPAPCNCTQPQCPPCNGTAQNTSQPCSAYAIINEVMYNPLNESGGEYVELYNPTTCDLNLSGLMLSDNVENETLQPFYGSNEIIGPQSFATITDTDTSLQITGIHLSSGDNSIGNGLSNSGDWITVYYQNSTVMNFINYTKYDLCGNGFSLERCQNQSWICHAGGTMGMQNFC